MNGATEAIVEAQVDDAGPDDATSASLDQEATPAAPERVRPAAFGLTGLGLLAAALILLVAFGQLPYFRYPRWTMRFAGIVLTLPVGAVLLTVAARRRDRAAQAAIAFLAIATVSAISAAGTPWAIFGVNGVDANVVTFAGVLGLWAIGRRTPVSDRDRLERLVTFALAANIAFGVFQVVAGLIGGPFISIGGRATGLLDNPVYFGSAVAGGLGLVSWRSIHGDRRRDLLLVVWFALGVGLSGSRIALIAALLGAVAAVVVHRNRAAAATVLAGCGGFVGSWLLGRAEGQSAVERVGASGYGRSTLWRYGIEAWLERPWLGWGSGRFKIAVQGRFSTDFVRMYSPSDSVQPWLDPHNLAVNLLTTTGLLGVLAIAVFAVCALRHTSGPWRALFLMSAITWLAQPATVHSLPTAMLALGLAWQSDARRHASDLGRSFRPAVVAGVVAAALVAVPFFLLDRFFDQQRPDDAAVVTRWLGNDATAADALADLYLAGERDERAIRLGMEWSARATERGPERPLWWVNDALRAIVVDDIPRAERSLDRAFELQPTFAKALETRFLLASVVDDPRAPEYLEALCEVDPERCEPDPAADTDAGS